jgi:hypothetical protein
MEPGDADKVASIFDAHDQTELPGLVGVTARTLFRLDDLYFHLIEADEDILPKLMQTRTHPLFKDVDTQLAQYLRPYRESAPTMADSRAGVFYQWTAGPA